MHNTTLFKPKIGTWMALVLVDVLVCCHYKLYFLSNPSVIFLTQLHSISEYCRILNTPSSHSPLSNSHLPPVTLFKPKIGTWMALVLVDVLKRVYIVECQDRAVPDFDKERP
jgi:hypothetical protein